MKHESDSSPAFEVYLSAQELAPLKDLWGKGYIFDQKQRTTMPRPDANVIYPEGDLVIHFIMQEYGDRLPQNC